MTPKPIMDLESFREEAYFRPVIFGLLPERFTMTMLQQAYERVFQTSFDRRNFSRKMLSLEIVKAVGQEPSDCEHRPATLYQFNQEGYDKLKVRHPVQFEF